MSNDLEAQMYEDRTLRDAAKALVRADVDHLRADLARRGLGARIADRMGEGATDLFEEALEVADNHRGASAALLGAILLWFARDPIFGGKGEDEGHS